MDIDSLPPVSLRLDVEGLAIMVDVAGLDISEFHWDHRTGGRLALDFTNDPESVYLFGAAVGGRFFMDGEDIPGEWLDTEVAHMMTATLFVWRQIEIVGELTDPDGGEDPDHAHDLNR